MARTARHRSFLRRHRKVPAHSHNLSPAHPARVPDQDPLLCPQASSVGPRCDEPRATHRGRFDLRPPVSVVAPRLPVPIDRVRGRLNLPGRPRELARTAATATRTASASYWTEACFFSLMTVPSLMGADEPAEARHSRARQAEHCKEARLAEGMGFEPTVRLYTVQRFSKPPPSATRPPLRRRTFLPPSALPTPSPHQK